MKLENLHELKGNRLFKANNYKTAIREFRKIPKTGYRMNADTYVNWDLCLNMLRNELPDESREQIAIIAKQCLVLLLEGIEVYPRNGLIWRSLALRRILSREREGFSKAVHNYVSLIDSISEAGVYIISSAFLMGDLEICIKAIPKYLRTRDPYRKIQTDGNLLAEVLTVFGPAICSEEIIAEMMSDWYADGYWYTDPDNRELVSDVCYVALFRRQDVREWVISLPFFNCSHLDKVAVFFKIIVHYFNGDMDAVKAIFRENLPETKLSSWKYAWILSMAEEIFGYERDQGRFDEDCLIWFPEMKSQEELNAEEVAKRDEADRNDKENRHNYEKFLSALVNGRYKQASRIKNTVRFVPTDPEQYSEADERAWSLICGCMEKKERINEAIRILYTRIRKKAGNGNFPPCLECDVLFALLYSKEELAKAQIVISEQDDDHPLSEQIKVALAFELQQEVVKESALQVAKNKAMKSFDGLQEYLKQHPRELRYIVNGYISDPRRAKEEDTIAYFIYYIVFHEAVYLGNGDVDEGIGCLFSLLPMDRDDVRKEIHERSSYADFERAWKIIETLRRIERALSEGCLSKAFHESLDSDVDFALDIAQDLIGHNWCKNDDLKVQYGKLLLFPTLDKLGVQNYAYLFVGNGATKASKKKKRRIKLNKRQLAGVTEALAEQKTSIESDEWKFFVSRTPDTTKHQIDATEVAFNQHFEKDALINVSGAYILFKLKYLLGFDICQLVMSPRLKGGVYAGWHKMKLGRIRIFWRIDHDAKEIYFAVLNKKDIDYV